MTCLNVLFGITTENSFRCHVLIFTVLRHIVRLRSIKLLYETFNIDIYMRQLSYYMRHLI